MSNQDAPVWVIRMKSDQHPFLTNVKQVNDRQQTRVGLVVFSTKEAADEYAKRLPGADPQIEQRRADEIPGLMKEIGVEINFLH